MSLNLPLCDTHVHLSDAVYDDDRDDVVHQAREAGLRFLIDVGTNLSSWNRSRDYAPSMERVFVTLGIHPHDASSVSVADLEGLITNAWWDGVRAIGEIGLDYHYDFSPRDVQQMVFEAQLSFAARRKLPVVLHVRKAWSDALSILRRADLTAGGVVHCFDGDWSMACELLDLGLNISVTGMIAFPRADELRVVVSKIPLARLFLETDAPYLAPPPFRGRRNHPRNVRIVAETIASVRKETLARVAETTTEAAANLFGVDP